MVDKPGQIALFCGVNDLAFAGFHQVSTGRDRVLFDPSPALFRVNGENLANVLHDEVALANPLTGAESPALAACRKRVHEGVLVLLELAILAQIVASAGVVVALGRNHAVDAPVSAIV